MICKIGAADQQLAACRAELDFIEQTLGKALGYPEMYPHVSQSDDGYVCVGEHTASTLAMEAAGFLHQQHCEGCHTKNLAPLKFPDLYTTCRGITNRLP
jgi:hypothetical protein